MAHPSPARQALRQHLERDASLEPRQRGADAEVNAMPEGEVRGRAADVEAERILDLKLRLDRLEPVVAKREWLAGSFSIADILMADVLRLVDRFEGLAAHPATRDYLKRATARPAFVKAHADQIAHFAKADT